MSPPPRPRQLAPALPATAALACALACLACLPGNPAATGATMTATDSDSSTSGGPAETGGDAGGLLACDRPTCTFVLAAQTLDDRLDIFDVSPGSGSPALRGRLDLDLKPDPSGLQTAGNLLDEPYGLSVGATGDLRVLVGHYPDTTRGSLLVFPPGSFSPHLPGDLVPVSAYSSGGAFTSAAGVRALELNRQEAIFMAPHAAGWLLIGVFANDLRTLDWPNPSALLVVDPSREGAAAIGAVDLGALDVPCRGAWGITAVDDPAAPQRLALACDGSDSVALVDLPLAPGAGTPAEVAAAATGCGINLLQGPWTTRFAAPDGAGGVLVAQTQLLQSPRLWRIGPGCAATPSTAPPAPEAAAVRLLHETVFLSDVLSSSLSDSAEPTWLAAASPPAPGIYVIQGTTPRLCGVVSGLSGAFSPPGGDPNAPYALALAADGRHLAIGAGPASNPELAAGQGQVLWVTFNFNFDLNSDGLATCDLVAEEVVDLSAGLFNRDDPKTWARGPHVIEIVTREGSAG